jgi:hypothetical protein
MQSRIQYAGVGVRLEGDMRRLIAYVDSLMLGIILGMVFVAIVHACPSSWQERVRASGIAIGYEQANSVIKN